MKNADARNRQMTQVRQFNLPTDWLVVSLQKRSDGATRL